MRKRTRRGEASRANSGRGRALTAGGRRAGLRETLSRQVSLSRCLPLYRGTQAWEGISPVSPAVGPNIGSILARYLLRENIGQRTASQVGAPREQRLGQACAKASLRQLGLAPAGAGPSLAHTSRHPLVCPPSSVESLPSCPVTRTRSAAPGTDGSRWLTQENFC